MRRCTLRATRGRGRSDGPGALGVRRSGRHPVRCLADTAPVRHAPRRRAAGPIPRGAAPSLHLHGDALARICGFDGAGRDTSQPAHRCASEEWTDARIERWSPNSTIMSCGFGRDAARGRATPAPAPSPQAASSAGARRSPRPPRRHPPRASSRPSREPRSALDPRSPRSARSRSNRTALPASVR